ncbi:MAG: carboxypeptidase M32, partial [Simkaniaceae bacterium]|nr:carboxypeptidase M32 [Simkaniaceae bacterium]
MSPSEKYQKLCEMGEKVALLGTVSSLLDWDLETYLPKDSLPLRSKQVELMAEIKHKEATSPTFGKLLFELIDKKSGKVLEDSFDDIQKAALREWRNDYLQAVKLPDAFVASFAKATSQASRAWDEAKQNDTFATFAPHLKTIVDLCRKRAELLGYEGHPYNALVNEYEPKMRVEFLDELFGKLKPILTEKVKKSSDLSADPQFLHGEFDGEKVLELSKFLLETQCLDMNSARIDVSAHPFCSGAHPKNIRLTSHRETSHVMGNISAVMHEGGHALYEQGIEEKYFGTPIGESVSLGIHESQSRFWECFIGQSRPFCTFLLPHLQKFFPEKFKTVTADELYAAINKIRPSFIRIHADEVTYILHV